MQGEGSVQAGLAAEGRQDRIRLLLLEDALDDLRSDRLDVGHIRRLGVRHDRGRIGVHQDDPVALLPQRLAGLGSGVVELAGLADHDRATANDQDGLQVFAAGHRSGRVSGPWGDCRGGTAG